MRTKRFLEKHKKSFDENFSNKLEKKTFEKTRKEILKKFF
jgi:hypothetical protein